ncbi:esterase-like activity of phytase family protein [Bordetella sp. 2513F-2]
MTLAADALRTLARHAPCIARTAALACALGLAHAPVRADTPAIGELRLIGEQRIAHRTLFGDTVVGGLSDLDYDPRTGDWVLVSDDRSDLASARFYTARLDYEAAAFRSVLLTNVTPVLQADGAPYPSRLRAGAPPDMEAIRFDPLDGSLWYASEGDRLFDLDPVVRHISRNGRPIMEQATPPRLRMRWLGGSGPRNNRAYEGMAFAPDGQSMWVAMEAPLLQDGPLPTPDAGALVRITQYDRTGTLLRQLPYPLDAIPAAPAPAPGRYADNGVSALLAVDEERLLVLERSAVQGPDGTYRNHIRLYEADVTGATELAEVEALQGAAVTPMTKRLVLDLDTLDLPRVDNIEGMAWGPTLDNGRASLVMVSDDNFNPAQVTQLLAFQVLR